MSKTEKSVEVQKTEEIKKKCVVNYDNFLGWLLMLAYIIGFMAVILTAPPAFYWVYAKIHAWIYYAIYKSFPSDWEPIYTAQDIQETAAKIVMNAATAAKKAFEKKMQEAAATAASGH
jgi:flagellar biosynthesis component FlhA